MRSGDHAQRAELAKAMRPRFGETAAEMEDRLRRATAPPADAQARRRVMAQSSLWTRLDKEREDALALPEGLERDMAVRVASEKRLKTEMFMWKRLDPDQVTAPSVVSDLKGKPARARAMRERTVYQFGVLLCRRLLEDAQSSLSTRMDTYVKGAMKRFRYSAARLDTSFFTKQFTIEDIERKEATGLSETYFASRSSLLMSAEKIDREFHKVREAALYGKKLATGNGYLVGGAAKPAKATPNGKAQDKGGLSKLAKQIDRLASRLDKLRPRGGRPRDSGRGGRNGGGGRHKDSPRPLKKPKPGAKVASGDPNCEDPPCYQCIADGRPKKAEKHAPAACWTVHPELLPARYGGPAPD
jgi:hypothetical protein